MSVSPEKVSINGTEALESSPLLLTKLYAPPPRPSPVPRPRLVARFNAGISRRLTLLSAPAGFGKTTLLCEWRAASPANEMPCAWLSLDAGDNDPQRFWEYVIAALRSVQAEVGVTARSLLGTYPAPPIERVLGLLLNDLGTTPKELLLILDDYHHIESAAIHEGMAFLLAHLPAHLHLVIASRSQPPLPLSLWRGRGELTELRGEDLRFSPAETADFLNRVMELEVTTEQAAALTERTEGWIVSLQMAALALQGQEDVERMIAGFSGSHRSLTDYLVEQVLKNQPASVQGFLLQTSVLERMCDSLCQAVTDESDGQAMLAHLEAGNLFVVPLDDQRHWYRYHHLFAEVMRNRLAQMEPDTIPGLHRRAARWYAGNGLMEEAMAHGFAAGDYEWVADLMEERYSARRAYMDNPALARYFMQLPPELMYARPRLINRVASTLGLAGIYYPAVKQLLDDVQRHMEGGELHDLNSDPDRRYARFNLSILRIHAAGHALDAEGIDEELSWLLARLPEEDHRLRHIAYARAANSYIDCGEALAAERAMSEAMRYPLPDTDPAVMWCRQALAWTQFIRGDLREAMKTWQQMLRILNQRKGSSSDLAWSTAWVHAFIGWVLYEWNDLDAAANHLQQAAAIAMDIRSDVIRYYSLRKLALARLALGDVDGADQAIWDLTQRETFFSLLNSSIPAWQARYWLLRGDLESASRWAQESGLSVYDDPAYPHCVFVYPSLIRVLTAQDRTEDALHLLDRLIQRAEVKGRLRHLIELLPLQAVALESQGESQAALDALEKAVILAEPSGFIRTFMDEGESVASLLRRLLPQTAAPQYVAKLLAAFSKRERSAPSADQPLLEPLTERELEVLGLLAQGHSNQEMADILFITPATVNVHLHHIYGKLDVHNRTQAVVRGQELNLLTP